MNKQRPQNLRIKYGINEALQRRRKPISIIKSSFLMSALIVFFFLFGDGILQAQGTCSITNFSATVPTCGTPPFENDSYFTVTFDVIDGSGSYVLINPANNISYGAGPGQPTDGVVSFNGQASITGVTPGGTAQVIVLDAMNAACMAGPITINVPICPAPDVTPPTSACADPIEVSSMNCGDAITPNIISGPNLWGSLPASGMLTIGIGLNGGGTFPIDFNCMMDETDPIDGLDIRLASSAFVTGPDPCMIYLQNTYDVRDDSGNIAPELLTIVAAYPVCNMEPPVVTCAEFTETFSGCTDGLGANTPSGNWIGVPPTGTFQTAIAGIYVSTIDLNGCVTDNQNSIGELEWMITASYTENIVPGCSMDIINEFQIRDACGNVSPTTFIFRGTIIYDGPPPTITCPANVAVDCGSSIDPVITGMASATSGCGTPTVSFVDGAHTPGSCEPVTRTWTATDGCGKTDVCVQTITLIDVQAPTSTCAEPIEITADFCPVGIGPGTPNGGWGNIPASGIIQLQVGPIHLVDLNCIMDNVSDIGDMEIRLASAQFIGTPTSCLRVLESVYDIRDAAGNIAPNLVTVHFTLENDDPITQTPSATQGITCGGTFTMQSQLDYIYTVEPPSNGVSSNQDCRSALIWSTPTFETPCGDFTDFSISFSAESSPAPNDLPDDLIYGGTSGNPVPDFSGPFGFITPSQYFHGSSEACSATTRVTYNLTDECGKTFTCFFFLEVTDNQDPIPMCNDIEVELVDGTYTLTQEDEDAIGAGSADNCGINPALSGILPTTFTRADVGDNLITYNVTDNCGNTAACVATVTVTCPLILDCSLITDQALECRSDLPPVNFNLVTAIDSCGPITKSALTVIPGNNGCPGNPAIITRRYFVNDGMNAEECMQTFTVESTIPPTITCPADQTIECTDDTNPTNTGMATGMASCSNFNLDITFVDASTQGMAGCAQFEYTIMRTWSATDECGRVASCVQTINVEDTAPPVITCPANVTIECDEDTAPSNTGMATGTDNCSAVAEVVFTFSDASTQGMAGCSQYEYSITRTWTATDACGNASTCVQTINVEDTTPPVITCPADVTIECDEDTAPGNTGMATGTDNCSAVAEVVLTFSDASSQGMAGCSQYEYSITRTWTTTDACGNASTCVQTINVEDTTPPVITCPADVTIECDEDTTPANNGMATGTDNCSTVAEVIITFNDVSTQGTAGCAQYEYSITRTWTATDACGNASTCVQTINVEDTTAPVISCPANQSLVCNTDPLPTASTIMDYMAIGGTASDNCAARSELTVNFVDTPPNQSLLDFCSANPNDRTLTRTYTVTDACGNASTCAQLFVYDQSILDPVITSVPVDQNVDCAVNAFPQPHLFTVETDCGLGQTITVSEASSNGTAGCPSSTIRYTYTATDVCGRSVSHTQTYTLMNEGPEFVCPVDICVIGCPADTDMIQTQFDAYAELATVISSCSETSISISNNFNPNGFIQQNCANPTVAVANAVAYQIVRFTASDACGRNATCTALVVITDTDGPVINGNVSFGLANCNDANLQQGYSDWATNQLNGLSATDECFNGTVNYSYTPLTANLDCSSGLASTEVSFIASDACGNETILTTFYRIIDNGNGEPTMATISGNILTEEDEAVEAVAVSLEGSTMSGNLLTSEDGYFGFEAEMHQNYEVSPARNGDYLNGITTLDLILLGQHLLEIQSLDSPYKMIAADINRSGAITSLDMIELRRMILLIDTEFSNNTSWRFVEADYIFPNPTNPFASTFPEAANINNLSEAAITDFIGVKIGDLNNSAVPNQLVSTGDIRSRETLEFVVTDQELTEGETYTVDFTARDFKGMRGYQFTLDYDEAALTFFDLHSGQLPNLKMDNFGIHLDKGALTCSWNDRNSVSLNEEEVLFSLSFIARKDGKLSEALTLNSSLTVAEAYNETTPPLNLGLAFTAPNFDKIVLYQNQPNPFRAETLIGFSLPAAGAATLTIYDITGRVVKVIEGEYSAGYHTVEISRSELGENGMWYYRLASNGKKAITKKMIVIE